MDVWLKYVKWKILVFHLENKKHQINLIQVLQLKTVKEQLWARLGLLRELKQKKVWTLFMYISTYKYTYMHFR